MKKRIVSFLLALVMAVSLLPVQVFAEVVENMATPEETIVVEPKVQTTEEAKDENGNTQAEISTFATDAWNVTFSTDAGEVISVVYDEGGESCTIVVPEAAKSLLVKAERIAYIVNSGYDSAVTTDDWGAENDVGVDKWEAASYNADDGTFTIPLADAIDPSTEYAYIGDSNYNELYLYVKVKGKVPPTTTTGGHIYESRYLSAGDAYSIDLSGKFVAEDNRPLTYKYSLNTTDGPYTSLEGSTYSGTYDGKSFSIYFQANDGKADSTRFYCVSVLTKSDTTRLAAAIENAPQDDGTYYTADDRYNGKTTSKKGFWSDYQTALTAAKAANTETARQTEIDNALKKLTDAIANLISTTQVNATALYEARNSYTKTADGYRYSGDGKERKQKDYSEARWSALEAALTGAENELTKLFQNGEATPYNSSTGEAAANVQNAVQALIDAENGLLDNTTLSVMQKDVTIAKMVDKLFTAAEQGNYTADSWQAFSEARTKAHEVLAGFTTADAVKDKAAYEAIINACRSYHKYAYRLTESGTIHVEVTVIDNLGTMYPNCALKDGKTANFHGEVALTDGAHGIADLGDQFNWASDINANKPDKDFAEAYIFYINDVLLYGICENINGRNVVFGRKDTGSEGNNEKVKLRDDDKVTIMRVVQPVGSYYGWTSNAAYEDMLPYLLKDRITTGGGKLTAVEGTPVTLNVVTRPPMLESLDVAETPAKGREIAVFGPQNEDGTYPAPVRAGVYTNGNGNAEVTFYAPGTYVVTAFDPAENVKGSKYPSLTGGAFATVTVSAIEGSALDAVRAEYLQKVAEAQAEHSEERMGKLYEAGQDACAAAKEAITAASSMQEIREAYGTMTAALEKLLEEAEGGFTAESFRKILSAFPTAAELKNGATYPDSLTDLVTALKTMYAAATPYQYKRLTPSDVAQYEAIMEAYGEDGSTLPAAGTATVTLQYQLPEGDTTADVLKISRFSVYMRLDGVVDQINEAETKNYASYLVKWNKAFNKAGSGWQGTSIIPGKHFPGWAVEVNDSYKGQYTITKCLLNGEDITGYGTLDGSSCSQSIPYELWLKLKTGSNVVTFVVERKTADIDSARNAALSRLETLHNTLGAKSDQAYRDGKAAINAAATAAAVESAYQNAVKEMKKAANNYGTVYVTVENTTFHKKDWGDKEYWEGRPVIKEPVTLTADSTMMSCVKEALEANGYSQTGAESGYISSITVNRKPLAEFNGGPDSGWMGVINDWFTNEGFGKFTVANGKLADGDEICIMYTRKGWGADLGGSWYNSDTTLKTLDIEGGKLLTEFASGEAGNSYEYTLLINGNSADLKLTPTASNKNYLTKIFLNEKVTDNTEGLSFYKRTQSIPVKSGDTIYIGCGEYAWPCMNNQGDEAREYTGTWYVLRVVNINAGADVVKDMIAALPDASNVKYENYQKYVDAVAAARAAYDALSESEQKKVDTKKLEKLEKTIAEFQAIDELKDMLDKLPDSGKLTIKDRSAVEAAQKIYDKLTQEQRDNLTFAQIEKLQKLSERMAELIKQNPDPTPTDPDDNNNDNKPNRDHHRRGATANSTSDTKTNGKDVKSGNTGDAGITLYLGMGLVAILAGAAVVARKRKENE